jgi:uncharacterized membrane protein YeaQ/YmgE (transglycosylase-associated protein family)
MINPILWLVAGALVGWLAGLVMRDRIGTPLDIALGCIGALLGGFLVGYATIDEQVFNLIPMLVAVIGAVIVIALVRMVRRTRPTVKVSAHDDTHRPTD